ncbi:MAG: DEAD/DEAH box helicase, partial [Gemmataceae bacterium]
MMNVNTLAPGGLIASRLPHFESRPQQVAMAEAVANVLENRGQLLVEAATGVGKSFAYRVPAIEFLAENPDSRVVVSTHTINLQEQLIRS